MMQQLENLAGRLADCLPAIAMAALGGLVRYIHRENGFRWRLALAEMVCAAFAGIILNSLLLELGVGGNYRVCAVSLAGYSSRPCLEYFSTLFMSLLKRSTRK